MTSSDEIYERLNRAFGKGTIHSWPTISRRAPRWWEIRCKKHERRINQALKMAGLAPLTEAGRKSYWQQIRVGQGVYEDAGSYLWRAWSAALGLPYSEPCLTYKGLFGSEFGEAS